MEIIGSTKELGATIRSERIRQGYTQTKLAHYAGVGINFISQLENGKKTAEVGKVLQVLHTLGINFILDARE